MRHRLRIMRTRSERQVVTHWAIPSVRFVRFAPQMSPPPGIVAPIYRFDISLYLPSGGFMSRSPETPLLEPIVLELAVLGLLSEQPLHGYELKKRLSETLGPLWGISFGSLYPAL